MIYFLLILALGDGIYIESYATRAECEIHLLQALHRATMVEMEPQARIMGVEAVLEQLALTQQ